jgi:hypothetical protein
MKRIRMRTIIYLEVHDMLDMMTTFVDIVNKQYVPIDIEVLAAMHSQNRRDIRKDWPDLDVDWQLNLLMYLC